MKQRKYSGVAPVHSTVENSTPYPVSNQQAPDSAEPDDHLLITITGKAGTGKTTLAEYLARHLESLGHNVLLHDHGDCIAINPHRHKKPIKPIKPRRLLIIARGK